MLVLDTDVVIDILRGYRPALDWLSTLGDEQITLRGFVAMELIQGCANKAEQVRIEQFLAEYEVDWPSTFACNVAFETFARLRLSHGIGLLDALIAHTAIELDAPLVTFNQKHYSAIQALRLVQLYSR